ncbi:MAG: HD-GYP domain-containing protein [Lachnospiraceae bacterium]
MRFVPIDEIQPGMVIVKNIYDEEGRKLLGRNKKMTGPLIDKIRRLGYSGIYICDRYSEFEELAEIIDEDERIRMLCTLKEQNLDQIFLLSSKIVDDLLDQEEIHLDFNTLRHYHNSIYEHSLNVAIAAVACGIGMGLNNSQLRELALSAMFHDIGKECVPPEVLDKPGPLTPEERAIINCHPEFGYEMLKDRNEFPATVRVSILQHHENDDGTGYPQGLSRENIFIYARIIHVADVFDALLSKRPYKEEYSALESIEYLMANCDRMFNYNVVSTFLNYITVYPVGVTVTLSTGKKAHVIKNRSEFVLRPVVMTEDGTVMDLALDHNYLNVTIVGK